MLPLYIFTAIVVLAIVFLVYCFIGFSRELRRKTRPSELVDPRRTSGGLFDQTFGGRKSPSIRNRIWLVSSSSFNLSEIHPQRDLVFKEEKIQKQVPTAEHATDAFARDRASTPRQAYGVRLRLHIARRRVAQNYHYLDSPAKYESQVSRR